ncbi:hypothetical protein K474DRAFT_164288 [Panus rudis PR-1116 ss-1]|nr:hypothetical protein K474DRAFT_164288 [Panus rudis PR-1116 ss-1]
MSSSMLRSSARASVHLRRWSSTSQASLPHTPTPAAEEQGDTPTPESLQKLALPPQKLRALVSLYHRAHTFVTRENLDTVIDQAFTREPSPLALYEREKDIATLRDELRNRRMHPKVGKGTAIIQSSMVRMDSGHSWSETVQKRERQITNALFGLEGRSKAGLEVVLEEHDRIKSQRERDEKS